MAINIGRPNNRVLNKNTHILLQETSHSPSALVLFAKLLKPYDTVQ